MISDTIGKQIREAMKAKDEVRLSTLKLLSAELHNEKIAKQKDLTEEEEFAVVKREAKKRKEAIEIYQKSEALERSEREKKELKVLQEFLPAELSGEELEKLVEEALEETGAKGIKDLGKVIGAVMKKAEGRADGKAVAQIVREKLS